MVVSIVFVETGATVMVVVVDVVLVTGLVITVVVVE